MSEHPYIASPEELMSDEEQRRAEIRQLIEEKRDERDDLNGQIAALEDELEGLA